MMHSNNFGGVTSYVFDASRNDATWQKITDKDLMPQEQQRIRESIRLQLSVSSQQQVSK